MSKIVQYIILLVFFCSCQVDLRTQAVTAFRKSFIKKVERTQQFQLRGFGGGSVENITGFFFAFQSEQILNLDGARRCVVDNVESLVADINSALPLREYLCQFPFTASRIEMSIAFKDKKGCFFEHPNIAFVQAKGGFIFYYQYNPFTCQREEVYSEAYDKALGIVEHQKNVENIEAVFGPFEEWGQD